MDDNVTGFTGARKGPTPQDIETFHKDADDLCKEFKEPEVTAWAAVRIMQKDGRHSVQTSWSKLPGCGMHEVVGAAQSLLHDILHGWEQNDG